MKGTLAVIAKEVGFTVPLVVRSGGNDVDAGRKILADAQASLPTLEAASSLSEGAERVVAAVS